MHNHDDVEDFLSHYGVKGMHWGIRKDESSQDLSSLSDKELSAVINRMRLESEYSRLSSHPSTLSQGLQFTKNHLSTIAAIASSTATLIAVGGKLAARMSR
jgi:hypothetical protein